MMNLNVLTQMVMVLEIMEMISLMIVMSGKILMKMDMEIIVMLSQMKIVNGLILMKMDMEITLKDNNQMTAQINLEAQV